MKIIKNIIFSILYIIKITTYFVFKSLFTHVLKSIKNHSINYYYYLTHSFYAYEGEEPNNTKNT